MGNLTALYRQSHKAETTCEDCGSARAVRCAKKPSRENPRGVFEVSPCVNCKPVNKVAPWFRKGARELTALHRKVRNALCLDALGFQPEQRVGPFRCDDVHHEKRVVVEVHGDYVHANPAKHKASDVIRLERATYTAREKWDDDAARTARLEALGYSVLVVWESDDLDTAREALWSMLRD